MEEKKLNENNLEQTTGGFIDGFTDGRSDQACRTVTGTTHYLALRSEPYYDERNEIARLMNGDVVQVTGGRYRGSDGRVYIYVYSPRFCRSGYVNENYIR